MGQGEDKIARSLLDLQPTAILEFYRIYPDLINKPNMSIDIHGGSIFKQAVTWQGIKYLPIPVEAEGFELTSNGKLPRPKIRIANKDFLITSLLQNNFDFKNAEIVRKRTFVKYLDDVNFDGGNPFGEADSAAEISEERYVIGQKTQENKAIVEFELTSPLDLENYELNHRRILGKYCYWSYRGAGCRYEGPPINQENGEGFKLAGTGEDVVPDAANFKGDDPALKWQITKGYMPSDIAYTENPKVVIRSDPNFAHGQTDPIPLKTWYVCVSGNTGQRPEDNPTYWAKDGCNKKLSSCKLRFNNEGVTRYEKFGVAMEEDNITISGWNHGSRTVNRINYPQRAFLISDEDSLTGFFTNDDGTNASWTIALFGEFSGGLHRAGILDTRTGWADFGFANNLDTIPQGAGQSEATDVNGSVGVADRRGKFTWFTDAGSRLFGRNAIGANFSMRNCDTAGTRVHGQWALDRGIFDAASSRNQRAILGFGVVRNPGRTLLVMTHNSETRTIKTYNMQASGQSLDNQPAGIFDIREACGPDAELDPRTNCFSLGSNLNFVTAYRGLNPTTPLSELPNNERPDSSWDGWNAAAHSAHVKYIGCAIWKRELQKSEIEILLENVHQKGVTQEQDLIRGEQVSTFRDYNNAPTNLTGDDSQLVAWWQGVRGSDSVIQDTDRGTKQLFFVDAHGGMVDSDGDGIREYKPLDLSGYWDTYSGKQDYVRPEYVTVEQAVQYYHLPFGGFPGTDGFTYQV